MTSKFFLSIFILFLFSFITLNYAGAEVIKWHETMDASFSVEPLYSEDGTIYLSSGYNYYAINGTNGNVIWKSAINIQPEKHILSEKYIYLRDYETLYALSRSNGQELWSYKYNISWNYINKVYARNNFVFISTDDNKLICLDSASGKELWSYNYKDTLYDFTVYNNHCYLAVYGSRLLELSIDKGDLIKGKDLDSSYYSHLEFIKDSLILIKGGNLNVFSLKEWDYPGKYPVNFESTVGTSGDYLFYLDEESNLSSISIKDGKGWKAPEKAPKVIDNNNVIGDTDFIYYLYGYNKNGICALNGTTGEIVWQKEYDENFTYGIIRNQKKGILYGFTDEGRVVVMDMTTGEKRGEPLNLGYVTSITAAPSPEGIIIGTQDSLISIEENKLKDQHFWGEEDFQLSTTHYFAEGAKAYFQGKNINYVDWKAYKVKEFKIKDGNYEYDKEKALNSEIYNQGTFYFPCGSEWRYKEVTLPLKEPGIYLIKAKARGTGKELDAVSEAVISHLGTLVKFTPEQVLVFVNNTENNLPEKDVNVKIYLNNKVISEGLTDEKGLFETEFSEKLNGSMTVFTEYNGNYSLYSAQNKEQERRYQAYVYTERPVYRPGHTVYFKGIVRKDLGDSYLNLSHKQLKLEVFDPDGETVYEGKPLSNGFGSFSGKFNLPENCSLGTYNIVTTINDSISYYATFSVEEYRKPEYKVTVTPEKTYYIQGQGDGVIDIQADYYFGQPVVGAKVYYLVRAADYYYSFSEEDPELSWYEETDGTYYYSYPDEIITEGEGITDETGNLKLTVPMEKNERDRLYTVEVTVTDESRREVTSFASLIAARGEFFIGAETENYVYGPTDEVTVNILARDPSQRPVPAEVEIEFNWEKWSSSQGKYIEENFHKGTVKLDEKGKGKYTFKLPEIIPSSSLIIKVKSEDSYGNEISYSDSAWVYGGPGRNDYPSLEIITDKSLYQYGDVAKIMINSSSIKEPCYALVCLERNKIEHYEVVKLSEGSTLLEFPIEMNYSPNVYMTVSFMSGGELISGTKLIPVPAKDKFINLTVTPDKETYLPGEDATFKIKSTDYKGNPIQSEVSLGVVDEAIYAIKPETTLDIRKFFYGKRPNYVITGYSIPEELSGGGIQKVPQNLEVRKDFKDTAYWNPFIVTDEKGEAEITFQLPDNLTTWRATARGLTEDTLVGSTVTKTIVNKKLLLRLITPRFLTQKDELVVTSVIHNYTEKEQNIRAMIEVEGVTLAGESEKIITIPKGGGVSVDWPIKVENFPESKKATFTAYAVSVENPEEYSDAMELSIPVLPHGQEFVETESGKMKDRYVKIINFPEKPIKESATLEISLSPSIMGSIFNSLEYLASYPYGCVEQTMSCFLPDIFVYKTMKDMGIKNEKLEKEIPDMVQEGLKKLYDYNHYDGGWGWWMDDDTNPYLTALVVYGLSEAKKAGFKIDEYYLNRGIYALEWLDDDMESKILSLEGDNSEQDKKALEELYRTRAYMAYSYVNSDGGGYILKTLDELYEKREYLNSYTGALLSLSYHETGNKDRAKALLSEIISRGKVIKNTCHWDVDEYSYGWFDNRVETTAWVLKAMMEIDPTNPKIEETVLWLMENRDGGYYWTSTKDTATAVYVLSDYMKISRELFADYKVSVYLNNKKEADLVFTAEDIGKEPVVLKFPPEKLLFDKGNRVEIIKEGQGVLYYSFYSEAYGYSDEIVAQDSGFTVKKEYCIDMPSSKEEYTPKWILYPLNWEVKSGEKFKVKLTIEGKPEYQYIMVEDYIPAGCEIDSDGDDGMWNSFYLSKRENRDNRVVFFINSMEWLEKGEIVYSLRAETPGVFHALPAKVEMMYNPHIKGSSEERVIVIKGDE